MEQKENSKRIELELPKYDEEDVSKSFGSDVIGNFQLA